MSFSVKKFTACLAGIALTLLTACGDPSATDALTNSGTNNQTSQTLSFITPGQTSSTNLLDSLAVLYPNGQLPANRSAQASEDLSQNPAALKLTAETATVKIQSTTFNATATVAAQAVAADYQPVQRVQNTTLYGAYFFSIYPTEITTALATNPNWRLEGPAFWASLATGADLHPVHRFRNKTNGSYLYSIYETERADIAANYAATFEYEGVAWYARQTPATGWSALYRFRNKTNGTYLFSAYESEKDAIVATYPDVFALEGIAYYVRQDAPVDPVPDTTPPVITVLGTNPLNLTAGTAYTEAGATCVDNKDPSCTVATTGAVNTATAGSYTITYTATDAASNVSTATRTVNVPAPTPADAMPTGAVIADRWFSDDLGSAPMPRLDTDGSFMETYPVPANAITNTEYMPTATCFVGANSSIPNCYDPVHSYWSIDTSAVDPTNRSLTYSMTVDAVSLGASILDMRANLQINPVTGKITQTCTPVVSTCFDSQGVVGTYEEFLVAVTAQPLGGTLPLVRTFKIRVRNDG
jgi:Domain of unknown function (DUF5011)/Repeat of unknown function (DUF5648)